MKNKSAVRGLLKHLVPEAAEAELERIGEPCILVLCGRAGATLVAGSLLLTCYILHCSLLVAAFAALLPLSLSSGRRQQIFRLLVSEAHSINGMAHDLILAKYQALSRRLRCLLCSVLVAWVGAMLVILFFTI